ncbi:MAG: hypothetical protein H0Z34_03345 [Brevibacillus sp.]|nr:hypothetical protein [Brevibacillus sp.]
MDIRLPHPPDYLICCYDSYQLTNHISAAMYVQYSLGLKQTQSFAIADMGALSPLLALEWVRLTRSEAMLVCMEQVYDRMESWEGTRFPRADALAMLSVSSRQGTYRVIAYEQQEVSFHPWEPAADERLAAASCQLIDNQLVDLSLDPDDVTVVVHSYSDLYLRLVSHHYPHVCCRADRRNLGTADCFYTLHELAGEETKRPFLLFVLADRRGGVGLLLVRCLTSMVEKGGTL